MPTLCHIARQRIDKPIGNLHLLWFVLEPHTCMRMGAGYRTRAQIERACRDSGLLILPTGVSPEQYHAVAELRKQHPHDWRAYLLRMWSDGTDDAYPLFRQLRNTLGPAGLKKLKF